MKNWFDVYMNEAGEDGAAGGPAASAPSPAPVEPEPVKAYWPDDWRDRLAGDDQKLRSRLDRFADPSMIMKSMIAAETKIRSGEYKKAAPDKSAAPEDIAAWKAENGIPDSVDGYDAAIEGVDFGEEDKPSIDAIRQFALQNNMPKDQAKNLLGLYSAIKEQNESAIYERDESFRATAQDDLRSEWGGDYRRNLNLINGLYEMAPEGLKDKLAAGRLVDGTLIGDSPDVLKWLAGIARELNPVATVAPGSAATAAKTIGEELEAIDAERRKDPQGFFKNEKLRARERELLTAQAKLGSR